MPTLQEITGRDTFKALPHNEQKRVLEKLFPSYSALPDHEKNRVLGKLNPTPTLPPAPEGVDSLRSSSWVDRATSHVPDRVKEGIKEEWPEMVGGTVGGITGALVGKNPMSATAGAAAGATAGGAIGQGAKQLYQLATESPQAPKSPEEAGMRMLKSGAEQGAYELIGGGVAKVGSKVLAPFKSSVTEEGKVAIKALDKYMGKPSWAKPISKVAGNKNPLVTPAEATDNWWLDLMDNIVSGSVLGGRSRAAMRANRDTVIRQLTDEVIERIDNKGIDPDVLGTAVTNIATSRWKDYKRVFTDPIYNTVDEMTRPVTKKVPVIGHTKEGAEVVREIEKEVGGVWVPMKELKAIAQKHMQSASRLEGIEAQHAGDDLAKAVLAMDDSVPFYVAQDLRSRLISRADDLSISNKKAPAIGLSKKMTGLLDGDISTALEKANPEAYSLWKQANSLYKEGAQKYQNRFIRKLVRKADPEAGGEPEAVLKAIFRNGGVSGIRSVKKVVDPQMWSRLQGWHVRKAISDSMLPGSNAVDGLTMEQKLFGRSGMGEQAMKEIYTPEQIQGLKDFVTTLQVVQRKNPNELLKMGVQFAQVGAMTYGIGKGDLINPTTITVIGGPEVLARLMLNPTGSKWLTQGLMQIPGVTKQKTGRTIATSARLYNLMDLIQKQIQYEREQDAQD